MTVASAVCAQTLEQSAPSPASPRRFEVALVPVAVQVNGVHTEHVGTFGSVTWYPRERIGFQVFGGGNWHTSRSGFSDELASSFNSEFPAQSLMMTWGAFGGVELEPLVGELFAFGGTRMRFALVLGVGAGMGGTRFQLITSSADTGVRFMGTGTVGARLQVGDRVTVRLGLRDILYSSKVTSVNGCDETRDPLFSFRDTGSLPRCSHGVDPLETYLAVDLIRSQRAELIQNLQLSLGVGVLF